VSNKVYYPGIQLEPWEVFPSPAFNPWPVTGNITTAPDPNTANSDAFGRQRVSNPTGLFAYSHQYDEGPILWEYTTVGTGAYTHLPNESTILFSVPAPGDYSSKQTRQYYRYQPGKSHLVVMTGVIEDGAIEVVLRSSASGAPVETVVPQAAWNIDPMDGTGPSGITADFTKTHIFVVDLQWLGVGRVRLGLDIDGILYYVHEFLNANFQNVVYMKSANLPIRYEIENIAGLATKGIGYYDDDDGVFFRSVGGAILEMRGICASLASEGGFEVETGIPFCADNGVVLITCPTATPTHLISMRPKDTFNGLVNRGRILPTAFETYGEANSAHWGLLYDTTVAGGAWISAHPNSIVEYNVTATYTGGHPVECGYIPVSGTGNKARAGQRGGAQDLFLYLPMVLDRAGTPGSGKTLTMFAEGVSGPSDVAAALSWLEFR
jgi:hypothetical protein